MARKRSRKTDAPEPAEDMIPAAPDRAPEPAPSPQPPPKLDEPSLFAEAAMGGQPVTAGYVVLARKYRPETFDDLIGQEAMVRTLSNAFRTSRIAQGYMLTGVRGVGKTTTARILARALNYARDGVPDGPTIDIAIKGIHCADIIHGRHPDVIEIDAASNTGIDNIREVIESARYKPILARTKVFIIDEVHMLSKGAFNALLKTLEEPPPHVKFIFATTEVRKVPVTVLSRCQRFDLKRVDVPTLARHLARIAEQEGARAEDEALKLVARAAEGSVRDALSILDQAIAIGEGAVTSAGVRAMLGLADRGRIYDLAGNMLAGRVAEALSGLDGLVGDGADPIELLADLAEAMHLATRIKVAGAASASGSLPAEEARRAGELAARLSLPVLARVWQMLLKGIEEAGKAPSAHAAAAMVVVRIAHAADLPPPEEVLRRLGGEPQLRRGEMVPGSVGASDGTSPPRAGGDGDLRATGADPAVAPAPQPQPAQTPSPSPHSPPAGTSAPLPDAAPGPASSTSLRTFKDVAALVGTMRDARLKVHLEEHVSLVRFDPQGAIELHLLDGAPAELANELREKLNRWTGRRWTIAVSRQMGARTLGEVERERRAAEIAALSSHPVVKAVLDVFPEARITEVRPIVRADNAEGDGSPGIDDEDESAVG